MTDLISVGYKVGRRRTDRLVLPAIYSHAQAHSGTADDAGMPDQAQAGAAQGGAEVEVESFLGVNEQRTGARGAAMAPSSA